jgi:hypothetical protein
VSVGERPAAWNHLTLRAIANGFELPQSIDQFQIANMLTLRIQQLAGAGVEGFEFEWRHGESEEGR